MSELEARLRTLRIMHAVFLATVPLYAFIGELTGPQGPGDITFLRLKFMLLVVTEIGVLLVLRHKTVHPARASLRRDAADRTALEKWAGANVISFALAETIALFGLVLRFMGGTLLDAAPFYLCGFLLLLIFRPQNPAG